MQHQSIQRRGRISLIAALLVLGAAVPAWAAGTLDKAKDSGKLTIGYAADLRPLAYSDGGKAAGFAVALCSKVVDAVKSELKLSALAADYVVVPPEEAARAVEQGKVDLVCGAIPTLERRALVDFSIPIMLSGTSVAVRGDAPTRLVSVLSGRESTGPIWRASSDQAPQRAVVAVVRGLQLEKELVRTFKERRIVADLVTVTDTAGGLQALSSGGAQAFFGDRLVLQAAVAKAGPSSNVVVLDRLFRRDVVALALRRDDDAFRLVVDRVLSRLYRSDELAPLYSSHFGALGAGVQEFFQTVALPD
ncbi:MAG TPA: amino acid ABC transporter substrate-binding protein [Burkholderiaceae bacterium]